MYRGGLLDNYPNAEGPRWLDQPVNGPNTTSANRLKILVGLRSSGIRPVPAIPRGDNTDFTVAEKIVALFLRTPLP